MGNRQIEMTTGIILIVATLILGGAIATVGDRIGTRVGKARLSLFKLRPRKTAVIATFLTGSVISGLTLAIMFAASEGLRTGVFKLEKIQRDLRHKRHDLENTRQQLEKTIIQKSQVENELAQARTEQKAEQIKAQKQQADAQKRLEAINQSLQSAIAKQAQTQAQLNQTQGQLSQIKSQFQQARNQLRTVSQQARALRSEITQLQAERQQLIEQRDRVQATIAQRDRAIAKLDKDIEQRDRDIASRTQVIAQRETRLKELERQQDYLEREVAKLEQYYQRYQVLRGGDVALKRGQVLAAKVVRIVKPSTAREAVDELLGEANKTAIQFTQPSTKPVNEQVLMILKGQVEQLIKHIDDGRDYVIRISSAGNYVLGEKRVQVFADVALNQVVFRAGDLLAAISADPTTMTVAEIEQRVEVLLGASKFRARSAGILNDTIEIADVETLIHFIKQLKQYNQKLELKAVAAEETYTAGPLKVQLVAVQNGQVLFRT